MAEPKLTAGELIIAAATQRRIDAAARRARGSSGGQALEVFDTQARLAAAANRPNPDERLSEEAANLIFDGIPANTRKTLNVQWWKFVQWCGATGREHLPATPATIVEWVLELGRRPGRYGRPTAPESVKTSLKVIAIAHNRAKRPEVDNRGNALYGYISPTKHSDVHAAVRGYTERWLAAGHRPDNAHPLTRAELAKMIATLDVRTPMGIVDAAVLTIGYDLGARRVELAERNRDDLVFHVADWGKVTTDDYLIVHIARSKTDHSGQGTAIPLFAHPAKSAALCPVRNAKRLLDLLDERGFVDGDSPLFHVVRTGGKQRADGQPKSGVVLADRIDGSHVEYLVDRAATVAGLFTGPGRRKHIVPHSLRAGPATEAGAAGADPAALNAHFRWSPNGTTGQKYARLGLRRSANPMRKAWAAEEESDVDV